ncbi:MAG TPA: tetratricopeptide repeat protein [Steroidobacteraceae bacterium]|nr:tetratricopeptide repeat protein [Steroidobacteraceae bacterium]
MSRATGSRATGRRARRPSAWHVLGAGLVLLALGPQAPADDSPRTIKDLTKRQIEVHPDQPAQASADKAMDNYRRFLELSNTDPRMRAEALRRLGDLNLESGQLDRMEKELGQIDLLGAEAIRLYTALLKAYPDYSRNDQVLYQLARAYETTGQPEKALASLDELVSRYPQAPQMDEVQFRRGELLFSAKQYRQAQDAYAVVIRHGPASSFYQQSLYKHGWSLFKQGENEESLPSFAGVLDHVLLADGHGPVRTLDQLSRPERELVDDTLRVISITFSYLEGAPSIDAFLKKHGTTPYAYLLYSRLGDLYVDKQRYQDAADSYRAFVARDTLDAHAPELAMQAIEAYRKGGFAQLVLDGKREYVERYNFGAPFWQGRQHADFPLVVQELKVNLKDVATYFHAAAQSSKHIEDYQQAARWYRSYLESFPDDPDSAATNNLLADALFESHQYAAAATEYERTAYDYPKNARSANAGYAALDSYQRAEAELSGAAKGELHKRALDSSVKFAQTFPEHPDSGGVLTRAAEEIFASHDLTRAKQVAQLVLARQPPVDRAKQRIAWTIVGQVSFDDGSFAEAEQAYIHARDLATDDPKMRTDLTERIAAAVYKQGEAKQKAGDGAGAIDDFLRVAQVAPDSKIQSTAEYDAATQLINLKQWDRAIGVLEDFRRRYPQHQLAPEVTRKLAVAYAQAGRPGPAAAEFMRIADTASETPAVRREALRRAADLYQKANDAPHRVAVLERFVAQYPTPLADAMEAREQLAEAAAAHGDVQQQLRWDREMVRTDAQAGSARTDRTRYLAAKAQLALAAPVRDEFRRIRLVAPLKKSLVAKRKAMEAAIGAYKVAMEYQVAEVTTAATYEMAELYRTLGKDVLDSERPKKLSKDELEQYETLLEEQAFPFEEQAISIHEANAARARDGVYDEWVRKSYAVLAQLKPARYGKTELTQDVVTTLR